MVEEISNLSGTAIKSKRHSPAIDFIIRLVREKPLGTVGGVITLIFIFSAIFSELLAPYGMNEIVETGNLSPASARYLLGTDQLGRDVLSRVIFGARISVIVGLAATFLSIAISAGLGILCGYFGGKFDLLVQRFVDAWMCFPGLIVAIVIITILGPGMWQVITVLGLLYGIGGSRVVRSAVIGVKENIYVEAARAIGCPTPRVLVQHILPNVMAPIIILFTTRVPTMILAEASMSFLGFGVPPPAPSWGGMLSTSGRRYMLQAPWLAIWPGLALALVVYGVNMFGDAIRDLLDPRLRGGIGRFGIKTQKQARVEKSLLKK